VQNYVHDNEFPVNVSPFCCIIFINDRIKYLLKRVVSMCLMILYRERDRKSLFFGDSGNGISQCRVAGRKREPLLPLGVLRSRGRVAIVLRRESLSFFLVATDLPHDRPVLSSLHPPDLHLCPSPLSFFQTTPLIPLPFTTILIYTVIRLD